MPEPSVIDHRLNWGCGEHPEPGWTNSDVKAGPGIDLSCDIRDGLPVGDDTFDYIVSIHALPMIPYPDVVSVLTELRRCLKPNGVLRLGLPDFDKGVRAYQAGNNEYFAVPDEHEATLGGKLIVQLLWYGYSVTLFTEEFAADLLARAGFREVRICRFMETTSRYSEIINLDNREIESLFIEAVK